MLVFGTQMHVLTFIFLVLETIMLFYQLVHYLSRPQDKSRLWYLILLFLLIFYNITGGLFPDTHITTLTIVQQNIIAYGSGFLTASYFPFYFYKGIGLKSLRFIAVYGVPLFLILPYLIFFVSVYTINGDLEIAIQYGLVIPFVYSIIAAYGIFKSIRKDYLKTGVSYFEITAVYFAVVPWASMTVLSYFHARQVIEVLFTNLGFVIITFIFISRSIRTARTEYEDLLNLNRANASYFDTNCLRFNLTPRETEIVQLIKQGMKYRTIAETLYISEKTVGNHAQHIFEKVVVTNKTELIHKLLSPSKLS